MMTPAQTRGLIRTTVTVTPVRTAPQSPEQPKRPPSREQFRVSAAALDPSIVFGCVDWYLYPDPERERMSR